VSYQVIKVVVVVVVAGDADILSKSG